MRQARIVALPSGGALHISGPEDAQTLLFLHGVGGAAWSWTPQIAALASDFRCCVWEARGHGAAARVADAGLGDYFIDAREALGAACGPAGEPAWLVGHSMGGLLALALAAEPGERERVGGLVLLEPVYAPEGGSHTGGKAALWLTQPLVASLQRGGFFGRQVSKLVFAASFQDRDLMERAWQHQRAHVPVEYPKMMAEAFTGPTNFPNRAFAEEIACPTLLIEGSVAKNGPRFPELVAQLRRLGARFEYEAIRGGHYLQLDRSEPFITKEIRRFVTHWSA